MKNLMIAVFALVLLGGAAAGGYFYFQKPAGAAGKDVKQAEKEKKEEDKNFQFVEMDPLILPIVDKNGLSQVISIIVVLEVRDEASVATVEKAVPRLQDAYIQDLYGMLNKHAAMKGGMVRVTDLKNRLRKVSREVVGKDHINDVLLQLVRQRPA